MMESIIFRYLISLIVHEILEMHLIGMLDVATNLYNILDVDNYIGVTKGFQLPEGKTT